MPSIVGLLFSALLMLPVYVSGQVKEELKSSATPKSSVPPDIYASESLVVERLDTMYRYAVDGTGIKEFDAVMRVQSEAALRQYGVLTIPFASGNEHVEILYVRVIKPDGSVVETPASDAQEMPSEVTRLAPFYSDLKEKQLPVRGLRVGDRLEYKVRVVRTESEAPGMFWGQESFATDYVALNESVELHVPKNKYVKVWSPENVPVVTEAGDEKIYRWTGSQKKPTVALKGEKDNKDARAEEKEIDPEGTLPAIAWTTFKSWDEVGAWYRGLEADRMVGNADVKAKTTELIAGKTTEEEKIRALYGYVSTQVRYIGVAFGAGRYQPHAATDVLRNQYGDCKDKHTLLAAMLGAAGFHPEAALIGAGIRMNEDVPSPAAFNHLITALPMGETTIWMDTTSEIAPYRVLIPTTRDKKTLVVPETGPAIMKKTPAGMPFAPFVRFVAKGTLSKEGMVKAQIEYTSRGDDELVMRSLLRQIPPGQWDQFVQRLSQGIGFGGTTSHAEASRPDATMEPEKLTYDYEREKTGDWNSYRILPLFPMVFLPTVDEKNPPKKQPIELGEPRVETSISTIELPDGWGAELPDAVHQKTAFATFDKTYKIDHETLTAERRIEILQKRVPAADWSVYKKWLDATVTDGESFIQLTSTGTKAGDKAPPAPGSNNPEAAKLVQEAYAEIERGEVIQAGKTLDQAQKINSKQESLWSTYGYMHFERKEWDQAIEAYGKELALYPNTEWVYRSMAQAQMNGRHFDDAINTVRTLVRLNPSDDQAARMLSAMLVTNQQYGEAVTLLEPLAARSPEDNQIQIALGVAQLGAGKPNGKTTLVAALKKTSEASTLNTGAYELANAGVELEAAEKSTRSALEMLTAESKDWTLGSTDPKQKQRVQLLMATWDTMGWVLFREGKIAEAERYVRASWLNFPRPEVAFHLGQIEEALGRKQAAIDTYELAKPTGSQMALVVGAAAAKVVAELKEREQALSKAGLRPSFSNQVTALQDLRKLPLGKAENRHGFVTYDIFVVDGKVAETNTSADSVGDDASLGNGESMVKGAVFTRWTPPGATAKVPREATLNCHSNVCELVVFPL